MRALPLSILFGNLVWASPNSIASLCEAPAVYLGEYPTSETNVIETDSYRIYENHLYSIEKPKYEWIDGKHVGTSIEYILIAEKYRTVEETVFISVDSCFPNAEFKIPNCDQETQKMKKTVVKQELINSLRIEKCQLPFEYVNGKTRILKSPGRVIHSVETKFQPKD